MIINMEYELIKELEPRILMMPTDNQDNVKSIIDVSIMKSRRLYFCDEDESLLNLVSSIRVAMCVAWNYSRQIYIIAEDGMKNVYRDWWERTLRETSNIFNVGCSTINRKSVKVFGLVGRTSCCVSCAAEFD